LKLAVAAGIVAVAAIAVVRSLRPIAIVEPVVSSEAVDARPGSLTVIAEYPEELKSESSGRLLDKDFKLKPGAEVNKGDVLGRLDPGDLMLQIEKDQNDLDAAKAVQELDHTGELDLEGLHAQLENYRRLNKMGSFSGAELAGQERAVKSMEQKVELGRRERLHTIATDENQLKVDERKLEKMTITSPFDAVISIVYKHPGDLVGQGDPLAELITRSTVVEGRISEEDFAKVRVGNEATVTFIPYGSWFFAGKVNQILPTADPTTQRRRVYLDVSVDADHPIGPGINGEVLITVDRHQAKAVIPRRALFSDGGDAVWVVRAGKVEERKVKRGFVWATGVEITEGLSPGEQVIVDELEKFSAGELVDVKVMPSDAHPKAK
jgi:RND family efflux transporter MFP subunit